MSSKKKYTAEDISRYLDGGMSPSEMHALEKEALNDPFLADAIEGIRGYDDTEKFFADAGALRERLNRRVKDRKKILVLPVLWKVAAVLLIVITGVAIIIYTGEKNGVPGSEIAKTEQPVPASKKADTPAAAVMADSVQAEPQGMKATVQPQRLRQKVEPPVVERADKFPDTPGLHRESRALESSASVADTQINNDNNDRTSVAEALQGRASGVAVQKDGDAIANNQYEKGDKELHDVVVVGYGAGRKRSRGNVAPNSLQKRIVPEGGWEAFENYLTLNKRPSGVDSAKKGTEKVSFLVDQKGRPSEIKILRSLSKAHDNEVIRLLNEGPGWEVVKGKKRRVTLSVMF